jgi:phosphatidylglycerol:prolipoprotein diacylglycerol transferase
MHPTLFDVSLFGRVLAIDAHGLSLTLGAIAAIFVASLIGRRRGLPTGEVRDLGLELILVGILGARLVHVALHVRPFIGACSAAVNAHDEVLWTCLGPLWIWEGGLSFYGGLSVALLWLAVRAPRRRLAPLELADLAAPGLALGYAFTCLGCFLSGCCFGRPTHSLFGVRFPPESVAYQTLFDRGYLSPAAASTPPLQPVQLYCAAAHLLLFGLLYWLARRGRPAKGRLLACFLVAHAIVRLLLLPFADPV